jgi:hypothetical protein
VKSIGQSLKHKTYIRGRKEGEAVYEEKAVEHFKYDKMAVDLTASKKGNFRI